MSLGSTRGWLSDDDWGGTAMVIVALVAHVSVSTLFDGVVSVSDYAIFQPSSGLAIPFGLVFGLPGALGVGAGVIAVHIFTLTPGVLLAGVAHALAAYLACVLWNDRILPTRPTARALRSVKSWLALISVTLLSSTAAAALVAWGYEILGLFPFYVSFLSTGFNFLAGTAVLAPVVLLAVRTGSLAPPQGTVPRPDRRAYWGLLLIAVSWATGGVIGSLAFTIREKLPLAAFARRDLEFLYELVHPDLFGHGGRRAQVVFGGMMLTLLVAGLAARRGEPWS